MAYRDHLRDARQSPELRVNRTLSADTQTGAVDPEWTERRITNEEADKMLRRYWTNACKNCSIKPQCTPGSERRITRWEHEDLLDAVQQRLDANPLAMRLRRETVEHPFGTMKARMGATHFLTKTLPKVAAEMALSVLAYNLTRAMNILGIRPLIAAIAA